MRHTITIRQRGDTWEAFGLTKALAGIWGEGPSPATALAAFAGDWAARLEAQQTLKRVAAGLARGPQEAAKAAFQAFDGFLGWDSWPKRERCERAQNALADTWEHLRRWLEENGIRVRADHSCCEGATVTDSMECPKCEDCDGDYCGWTTEGAMDMEEFERLAREKYGAENWDMLTAR